MAMGNWFMEENEEELLFDDMWKKFLTTLQDISQHVQDDSQSIMYIVFISKQQYSRFEKEPSEIDTVLNQVLQNGNAGDAVVVSLSKRDLENSVAIDEKISEKLSALYPEEQAIEMVERMVEEVYNANVSSSQPLVLPLVLFVYNDEIFTYDTLKDTIERIHNILASIEHQTSDFSL